MKPFPRTPPPPTPGTYSAVCGSLTSEHRLPIRFLITQPVKCAQERKVSRSSNSCLCQEDFWPVPSDASCETHQFLKNIFPGVFEDPQFCLDTFLRQTLEEALVYYKAPESTSSKRLEFF